MSFSPEIKASLSPRGFPSKGIIMCTYFHWFKRPLRSLTCESPIYLGLPAEIVKTFVRFRFGCSNLPIDKGRHQRISRCNRHCPACQSQMLCDEYHIIFECAALTELRIKYKCLFTLATQTMPSFMWQKNMLSVAKFVTEALNSVLNCWILNLHALVSQIGFRDDHLISQWCGWKM